MKLFCLKKVVLTLILLSTTATGWAFTFDAEQRAFLDQVQEKTFQFFWNEHHPKTGLVKDKAGNFTSDSEVIASIAATGFGLSAMTVGVERGWITREEGLEYTRKTLRFFKDKLENVNGFFYHFVHWETGKKINQTELSSIDTALFLAGAIQAAEYYQDSEIKSMTEEIYSRINFQWMLNEGRTLSMGWKEKDGFLKHRWSNYDESLILYVLAIGSPTFPIAEDSWHQVKKTIGVYGDYTLIQSPPLFTHQYSQVWLDIRNRNDGFADYFKNSTTATLVNRQFCIDQSKKYKTYSDKIWGLTASVSPFGYKAYGSEPGGATHDGTVAPTAAGGSIVFTPELSYEALRAMYDQYQDKIWGRYGFADAFNVDRDWRAWEVLGIDQGPILLMIENQRSELLWKNFMKSPHIQRGLQRIGFKEGTIELKRPKEPIIQIKKSTGINIDGDIEEWSEADDLVLDLKHKENGEITTSEDLSAVLNFMWDEDFLYLAARVEDDSLVLKRGKKNIWKDDLLELYVDPANDGLEWGSSADAQIGFSPSERERLAKTWAWFQGYDPQEREMIDVQIKRRKGGYDIEARIMWDLIGITPRDNVTFGLTPAIHDLDQDKSEGKLNWYFLKDGKSERFSLGKAILV